MSAESNFETQTENYGGSRYDAVIVHYNNEEIYDLLIRIQSDKSPPRSISIADNSKNIDASRIHQGPSNVIITPLDNPGYAAGVNRAWEAIAEPAEYLLILTHEVGMSESAISELNEMLDIHGDIGLVGPVLYRNSNPDQIYSAGGVHSRNHMPKHCSVTETILRDGEVDYVDGAAVLVRSSLFEELGGFDETFFLYYEDNEICDRIRSLGFKVVVDTRARMSQEPGNFDTYYQVRNYILLAKRYVPRWRVAVGASYKICGAARRAARGRDITEISKAWRGLIHGWTGVSGPAIDPVLLQE